VELGCGNGMKAKKVIQHLLKKGRQHFNYFGVDYSEEMLVEFKKEVQPDKQSSQVNVFTCQGLNNQVMESLFKDNKSQLLHLPTLVIQLGSSVGCENEDDSIVTLASQHITHQDALLVTFDLIKDLKVLELAYNNEPNEKFIKNYLSMMNEELGSDFDLNHFKFISSWDYGQYQMNHYLQSLIDQTVHFKKHDISVQFFQNESLKVSNSRKYNISLINKMA